MRWWTGLFAAAAAVILFSSNWGAAQPEPAAKEGAPGLRGIWPEELPPDLYFEEFDYLGNTWAKWSEQLADDVAAFYDLEGKDAAAQREAIAGLRKKLATMKKAMGDERYRVIHDPLIVLYGRIDRRLDLAEAILDTLQAEPAQAVDEQKLREELQSLVAAIERYEAEGKLADSTAVRKSYQALSQMLPDGAVRIRDVLRDHYFNYNMQFVATEGFLSKLIHERRIESGPVRDYILGADVYGNQTTDAVAGVDLKPSNDGAIFDIVLTGVTRSDTAGYTRQATVYTHGYHRFRAAREVFFNGETVTMAPRGRISVDANNRTVGASTRFDGVPLIGHIARSIARSEAARKRGESEAIAAGRVADRVLPRFEEESEESLEQRRNDIHDWNRRLAENGLAPNYRRIRSTRRYMMMSSRVMNEGELGGATPNYAALPAGTRGVTLRIHESLLNNIVNQMDLAGREMTRLEVEQEFEQSFEKFTGREYKPDVEKQPEDDPDKFVFDPADPVRLKVDKGRVLVILRVGLKREGQDDIPPQQVTVPLTYRVEGDQIVAERGGVAVAPIGRPESQTKQIVRAGILRKKIEDALPTRTRDRRLELKREGKEPVYVTVGRIEMLDGWATIWGE